MTDATMCRAGVAAFCFFLACGAAVPAGATVVNGTFAGVVTTQSGDADALFGTTGGIAGQPVLGSFSYDTGHFNAPAPGSNGFGRAWDSTDGSMDPATVQINMTINGVLLQYTGLYYNDLIVVHGCPGTPGCGPWPYNDWRQLFSIVSENNVPQGANAAQINLGMLDNSADLTNAALDPAGPFNLQAAQIESNAANWWLPGQADPVTWNFHISSISVPEPAGAGLLAAALLGLAAARRRRAGSA